jgi:hypothetical protein
MKASIYCGNARVATFGHRVAMARNPLIIDRHPIDILTAVLIIVIGGVHTKRKLALCMLEIFAVEGLKSCIRNATWLLTLE